MNELNEFKFKIIITIILLYNKLLVSGQYNPNFKINRTGIIELFQWTFIDIANECENFLGPKGFAGVEVSPVQEHVIIENQPWWERYQPMSYIIWTRLGNENDFLNMTTRCNNVGVRIYVDIIINHMAKIPNDDDVVDGDNKNGKVNSNKDNVEKRSKNNTIMIGTFGSKATYRNYPAVPYSFKDFHVPPCLLENTKDAHEIRNCDLSNLPDLNHTVTAVQNIIVDFMNHLIYLGVAGFRVSSCRNMWPNDLKAIYNKINYLNTKFDFPANTFPFIYHDIYDMDDEPISKTEYMHLGVVTEYLYVSIIEQIFNGILKLEDIMENWGPSIGLIPNASAMIFIDDHDNQRIQTHFIDLKITYKQKRKLNMAVAFMLSFPYGIPKIMSSYNITDNDFDKGPPTDEYEHILSPMALQSNNIDDNCINGWICEHRWHTISNMIQFANVIQNTKIINLQIFNNNQIAFCRGYNKGFIIFNNNLKIDLDGKNVNTCLLPGIYCDIISGNLISNSSSDSSDYCSGLQFTIDKYNRTDVQIKANDENGFIALHAGARLMK